jgi:alginate O-acetyltransferase complex protein AlgI
MVACGLWHGASWHYIVFGAMQGVGLIVNRAWKRMIKDFSMLKALSDTQFASFLGIIGTMAFITASFTIFRAPNVTTALQVFKAIAGFNSSVQCTLLEPITKSGVVPILIAYMLFWLITTWLKDNDHEMSTIWTKSWRWATWTAACLLIIAASPTEAVPFVYFQF